MFLLQNEGLASVLSLGENVGSPMQLVFLQLL